MAAIGDALARPDLSGLVLVGPAGVGKTRLAAEALRLAEQAGFVTVRLAATRAAAEIPLGAVAPLLPADAPTDKAHLLASVRRTLLERAAARPLLVLVDDGHCLDPASAALIHQVAGENNVFVLVTLRSDEQPPDPVVSLWKDGLAERVEVGPLDHGAFITLVEGALGGPVDGALVRTLWDASRGSPLFTRELILGGQRAGALDQDAGIWRLRAPLTSSTRLVELVGGRLADASAEERSLLELLALGEPLGLPLVERLGHEDELDALERRGLAEVRADGRRLEAWLGHPLYGEVLRSSMPALRARSARRSLAAAVEETGARRRGDLLRVVSWQLDAGLTPAASALVPAARTARVAHDFDLAERLARTAWTAHGDVDAGHLLGQMLGQTARHDEAEEVLVAAQAAASSDEQLAVVVIARTENLFRLGRDDEARRLNIEAEQAVAGTEWEAELLAHRATFELLRGHPAEALQLVEPLLHLEGRVFIEAAIVAVPSLGAVGRAAEAVRIADRAYPQHVELWDVLTQSDPGIHLIARTFALIELGRFDEADEMARLIYDGSLELGSPVGQAWSALLLGRIALRRGQMATSLRWHREATVLFRENGLPVQRAWSLAGVRWAAALLGDAETVAETDAELVGLPAEHDPYVEASAAWASVLRGERSEAVRQLSEGAERALASGQRAQALHLLVDLARLGEPAAAHEAVRSIVADYDGELGPALAGLVEALASGGGDALEAAGEGLAHVGANLLAAEAFVAAAGAHRAAGLRRRETASERRAADLVARCEGARTPGLTVSAATEVLTPREREVATLAAGGARSKDIAERLYVSVRTVENHLQRVYEKLGVRGRAELAAFLEDE
jgi:DNA-binding CsgD family transcriptional regulator/tetratricopeptide (TPR) repeat protein